MVSLLANDEAHDAIDSGTPDKQGCRWSALESKQIDPETTGGGWRQNDWKVKRRKRGTPSRVNLSGEFESSLPHRVTRELDDTAVEVRAPV